MMGMWGLYFKPSIALALISTHSGLMGINWISDGIKVRVFLSVILEFIKSPPSGIEERPSTLARHDRVWSINLTTNPINHSPDSNQVDRLCASRFAADPTAVINCYVHPISV